MYLFPCIAIICLHFAELISALPDSDKITDLPDLKFKPNFQQYSGYLGESFYWYFSPQNQKADQNVIIWLKSDLWCSPISGVFREIGPFRLANEGVVENVYAWNKLGHLLFLDLPYAAGFSQNTVNPTNDQLSTKILASLQEFVSSFNLTNKNIYLVGGEYSSEILTTLTLQLFDSIHQNKTAYSDFKLKGLLYMSVMDEEDQFDSLVDLAYVKGFTSQDDFEGLLSSCQSCENDRIFNCKYEQGSDNCSSQALALNQGFIKNGIDELNMYGDCYRSPISKWVPIESPRNVNNFGFSSEEMNGVGCGIDELIQSYLNRSDVIQALHVDQTNNNGFKMCSGNESLTPNWLFKSNIPKILNDPVYVENKIRSLLITGDLDLKYNHLGVEKTVDFLVLNKTFELTSDSDAWMFNFDSSLYSGTVGGYMMRFTKNFDYSTIKGAGHWISLDRPMQSIQIMQNFIDNNDYGTDISKIDLKPIQDSQNTRKEPAQMNFYQKTESEWSNPRFISAKKNEDLIKSLPGVPSNPKFAQYSGYLQGLGAHQMHYWLVESLWKPESSPLILWLNGGPGDSSLYGMFFEHGPWLINPDGKTLRDNPYSWNQFATVLYLESPVGVGFSYTTDANETIAWSDEHTMEENYLALKDFLQNFAEYENRDFYIIGESHGGIYTPMLASKVIDGLKNKEIAVNFKGIAAANGIVDYDMNVNSLLHILYYHKFMPKSEYVKMVEACCQPDTNEFDCQFSAHIDWPTFPNPKYPNDTCFELIYDYTMKYYFATPNNDYAIYQDCYRKPIADTNNLTNYYTPNPENPFESYWCYMLDSLKRYMRSDDVRQALHIPKEAKVWQNDTDVEDNYVKQAYSTRPYFDQVVQAQVKSLIYNGDSDLHCNHLGAEWFATSLAKNHSLKETLSRSEWYYQLDPKYQEQVAGYQTKYGDLIDVLTIKGAGHLSGTDRPAQLFQICFNFLNGLDYSTPYSGPLDQNSTQTTSSPNPLTTTKYSPNSRNFIITFIIGMLCYGYTM